MDDLHLIEKYLRAELSNKEEELFVQRVKSNPLFKRKALIHTLMVKAILNVGRQKDLSIRQSVTSKSLTWNKYILIYGVYSNYYFTGNMMRYNCIFSKSNRSLLVQ